MTDKTPQNKAEKPINTPTTLTITTDIAHDSELKGRALPQADELKIRFEAGSIPLQTDFANLIDLANMGRQAVGGAEGQTGPANGFTLSSEGCLELKPNAAKGISVDQDGVAIKIGKGMRMSGTGSVEPDVDSYSFGSVEKGTEYSPVKVNSSTNGLVVDLHQGLINTDSGLSVNVKDGLQLDSTGVGVKAGNGIAVTSSGVNIKLASGSTNANGGEGQGEDGNTIGGGGGLTLSNKGLALEPGDGIQINSHGVSIKLAANSGLSTDETNGLKIVTEQMFQKGMVMMFAGTEAEMPRGWALCDGNEGRPDLRDRFVMGSTGFSNVNKTNNKKVTGTDIDKIYMANSDTKTPEVSVTVNNHTLTIDQIPSHKHTIYTAGKEGSDGQCIYERNGLVPSSKTSFSGATGGDEAHNHGASATQVGHYHSVNVVPPYYILAFIIKL